MAVRDRNLFAWQAYVITMSFISVGLLLGMFFLWSSFSALSKKSEDQSGQLATAQTEFQLSEARVARLLSMLGQGEGGSEDELNAAAAGFAADPVLGPVEKLFAEQMNLFAQNVAPSEKNLIKLPKYLLDTIRARNEDIDKARKLETQILAEKTATLQRETKARQDAEAAQKKAEADLAATRDQHAKAIEALNLEKKDAFDSFDKYKTFFEGQLASLRKENDELKTEKSTLTETVSTQMDELNEFKNLDFAQPQGKILNTSNGGTIVWINLGREDGLREGTAFTVIDESSVNTSEAKDKAHLVVTRVIDDHPHLSQARVTDYSTTRPILKEDKVFSPAWRPGRTVGFALVGEMDVDGDYQDDIMDVVELIKRSGGKLDAKMDSKGVVDPTLPGMTPNTEFLVLGSDLGVVKDSSPEALAKQANYEKFLAEARRNGIVQISVDKLMGYLKADSSQRITAMGNRIQGKDFQVQPLARPKISQGKVSEVFQKRLAP